MESAKLKVVFHGKETLQHANPHQLTFSIAIVEQKQKQAGAELGQAQRKLKLGGTSIGICFIKLMGGGGVGGNNQN